MTTWDQALFAPRRVALIGASATPGKLGHLFMQNLIAPQSGFAGEVVAVHPTLTEILGRPAYPRLSAAPGGADLAVVVAPPGEIPARLGPPAWRWKSASSLRRGWATCG
jgi:acetyltransferase